MECIIIFKDNNTKNLLGNTNFHAHVPILFLNCKSLIWGGGILFYNPIIRLTTIPNVVKNKQKNIESNIEHQIICKDACTYA